MRTDQKESLTIFFDLDKCVGCHACEVACKQAHNLDVGPRLIKVVSLERVENGKVELISVPMSCFHCYDPPCLKVCPTKAIVQHKDSGAVLVNKTKCIGCKVCLLACPFGAPQLDNDGKMIKCDLCIDRLQKNEKPACVSACPVEALQFSTTREVPFIIKEKWLNYLWKVKGSL
jgi:Fe-S-cluster-containing dehydrogenase component